MGDLLADTIEMRADEALPEAGVAAYMRSRLVLPDGPVPPGTQISFRQFPGGHANLTYEVQLAMPDGTSRELVLRRPPHGPVAPKSHDMVREYRVMSRLWEHFPLAPRAFLLCEDDSVLGKPFFVMERRHGLVIRQAWPDALGAEGEPRTGALRRRIGDALVDALADLHGVDYDAAGLAHLGRPAGFLQRQVDGWHQRWELAKTRELPVLDEVAAWLQAKLPAQPRPSLVHNDWKLDNVMLDAADPGRLVAALDWDMCTVGDPFVDLGTLLSYWGGHSHLGDGALSVTALPGFPTKEEVAARYAARAGVDVSGIGYYEAFGYFKTAVVIEQIYVRYLRGQTHDARFALMADSAPRLAEAAAACAGLARSDRGESAFGRPRLRR